MRCNFARLVLTFFKLTHLRPLFIPSFECHSLAPHKLTSNCLFCFAGAAAALAAAAVGFG